MRGATLRDILLIVFVPGCLAVGTEDSAATLPSALLAVAASSCRFRWLQRATGQEEDDVSKLESKLRDKEINSVEDLRTIEDAGLWESFFMALGEGFLIMSKLRVALRKKPRHNPPDVGSSTSEVQAAGEQAPAVMPASSSQADATMAQEDQEMAAPLPQEDQQMAQKVPSGSCCSCAAKCPTASFLHSCFHWYCFLCCFFCYYMHWCYHARHWRTDERCRCGAC